MTFCLLIFLVSFSLMQRSRRGFWFGCLFLLLCKERFPLMELPLILKELIYLIFHLLSLLGRSESLECDAFKTIIEKRSVNMNHCNCSSQLWVLVFIHLSRSLLLLVYNQRFAVTTCFSTEGKHVSWTLLYPPATPFIIQPQTAICLLMYGSSMHMAS